MDYFSALIARSYITTADNIIQAVKNICEAQFTIGEKDFSCFDWEPYGGAKLSQTKEERNGVDRFLVSLEIPNDAKKACEEIRQACKLVCVHVDFQDRYYIQGTEWEILSNDVKIGTYFSNTKCNDEINIVGISMSPMFICGSQPMITQAE